MGYQRIKAGLNLNAVLPNLEDLIVLDPEAGAMTRHWKMAMRFSVMFGPGIDVRFEEGACRVRARSTAKTDIQLNFVSCRHLNSMFDGKAPPVLTRGVHRVRFLMKEFTPLTKRMEYFLKPTDDLLADGTYLALNTRLTLNTAAFAVKELAENDPVGKMVASGIRRGTVVLRVLPDGPAVFIRFEKKGITAGRGDAEKPMAIMEMKGLKTANAFLNGKIDAFSAIASGDVAIKGQTPMLDSLGLILDRVPLYLK